MEFYTTLVWVYDTIFELITAGADFACLLCYSLYMYKVNLNFFWHLAQGTLFGGRLGPQFSTHFSIIKMEEMKDYSTQCCSNLWKNEKRLFFFYAFNISFALIFRKWKMVLNNLTVDSKLNFICNIPHFHIYYMIFRKCYKLKASVFKYIIK